MSAQLLLSNSSTELDLLQGSQNLFHLLNESSSPRGEFVAPSTNMVIGHDRYGYSSHVNPYDREHWWIQMDHSYARPWNWRPESTFLRPTKTLFVPKLHVRKPDEEIDVVSVDEEPAPIYDKAKAKQLMEECERHASLARIEDGDTDWEDAVSRLNWSTTQNRLFNGIVGILNVDYMARLAQTNIHNESIARRITIDKSVSRVRKLMATVAWDSKYTHWLHQLLIEHLNTRYLSIYLDILQTLRTKLPNFVDKLMGASTTSRLSLLGYENLFPLLKRQWDPVASSLQQDKPKKLPGNPLLVVVPSTPISSNRMLKWINLLSNLATVMTIPANYAGTVGHKTTMMSCVDHMFVMTRNKIQDIRMDYPGRNIVLVGFGFGATLALQIAQVEQVLCVISIGFSLLTAEGRRGEADDNLLELQCPVLFVVGQCSDTSLQEDMEDVRERMRVETGLIIVGSADDNLRVNKRKKKAEGITQSIVDRCIVDEVGEFISGIILSPYPPQIRQSPTNLTVDGTISKKLKNERKRYNSNTSSVDSEPPSPTSRITRPGQNIPSINLGRPPGSKKKLEAKWTSQGTTSTPSNSPPHPSTLNTPDTSSNDSNLTDKTNEPIQPIKKIKTLKPTALNQEKIISTNQNTPHSTQISVKTMGFGNRNNLLQDYTMGPAIKNPPSGIRVLENVKLSSGVNPKLLTGNGRMVDMSKISMINPKSPTSSSIVLLPDGKIKNLPSNLKAPGRYITSKRQLLGNRPPKPVKKVQYIPTVPQSLPPPANLTSQDIMDLPIIFADDNQVIDPESKTLPQISSSPPKLFSTTIGNKFMLINKPNFIIQTTQNRTVATKPPPKYTKIILSKKPTEITSKSAGDVGEKKVEELDLEAEIAASTLFKPGKEVVGGGSAKEEAKLLIAEESSKRSAEEAQITEAEEGAPSKALKLEV